MAEVIGLMLVVVLALATLTNVFEMLFVWLIAREIAKSEAGDKPLATKEGRDG